MTNMAAGHRRDLSRTDSGAYSLSQRVQSEKRFESGLSSTLQNAMSIAHTQSESLGQMQKILTKMSEIASLAGSVSSNASAKEIYQAQFDGLIEDFNNFANTKLNDVNVFGSVRTAEGEQFLDSLKNNWLKASEDLIYDQYEWSPDSNDDWELVVDENGATGGAVAYVSTLIDSSGRADVDKMVFNLPNFNSPHTQPASIADTTVAHEMVHALQAQNSFFGDITGDGTSSANWFKEGLAEFIAGADNRVVADLERLAGYPNQSDPNYQTNLLSQVSTLVNKIGTGNEDWTSSEQYSAAYLAVRFLHKKLVDLNVGGIKQITRSMAIQYNAGSSASGGGLNRNLSTIPGLSWKNNDDVLNAFKSNTGDPSTGGIDFVNNLITSGDLFNNDTGSIRGTDAGLGSTPINEQDSVPDATGAPASKYTESDDDSPDPIIVADGQTLTLSTIGTLNFGDSSTYDLTSENGAQLVVSRVEELLGAIASNLGKIGSNMNAIETQTNLLSVRQVGMANKLENIQGVSIADESRTLSFSKILIDSNLSMRAQAMDIQRDATLMLLSA
jgi:flagellin